MALLCFFDCFTTRHQVPKLFGPQLYRPKAFQGHLHLAATYMMAGNEAKAREAAAEVLRIDPNFSLERFAKTTPWKNQDDLTNGLIEPLRKAGLK